MSQNVSLERMLADWMVDETSVGLPDHVFDQIVTTTGQRRPLPRWLAVLREPRMRTQSQVAVGVPTRQLVLIGALLLIAAVIAIGVGAVILIRPQPAADAWPGFRGDASRAGSAVSGPVGQPDIRWQFRAPGAVSSNIAVADELVLVPSDEGRLHALGILDGQERWSFAALAPVKGPLAVGDRAYVADGAGVIHALSLPDGATVWDGTTPYDTASDLALMDGRLFLGDGHGEVAAIDAGTGREAWRQTVATSAVHAPAAANGALVVASDAGDAIALDPATGATRWTTHVSDESVGTPVIMGDLVYVGGSAESQGGRLVALDLASGAERWSVARNIYSPSVADGIGYTGSAEGLVTALDAATSAERWTATFDGNVRAPAVAGGVVYLSADRERRVVALDAASGGELWSVDVDGPNHCCIALARGLVFVGTSAGTVYAIGGDGTALTPKAVPSVVVAEASSASNASPAPASSTPTVEPLPVDLVWAVGSGENDFLPWGLALSPDGRLWAAEGTKDQFSIFEPDGRFVESWGMSGSGEGRFDMTRPNGDPYGMVAFAPDGSFFVLDPGNRRVQAFDAKRKFLRAWGEFGRDPGQFTDPVSLAIDADGNVNVLDAVRGVIETYTAEGEVVRTIDTFPDEIGPTDGANQLAIGPNGHFYVSVISPNEVAELDRDGRLVALYGAPGTLGEFTEQPNVVQFDADGRMYVAQGPGRGARPGVQLFDTDGTYLGGFGPPGAGDADLGFPWGLVITDDGIYVADAGAVDGVGLSSLIRKFTPVQFP
jgi:outer membrane protein assembly factor BamB